MRITPLEPAGLLLIEVEPHGDARGFFAETFRRDRLAEAGVTELFVQDNHVRSPRRGTLRGLHFQGPPHVQTKLVRVARGAVLDVAVDVRAGSPTYGRHAAVELAAENWRQLYVPAGFAHGYLTLTDDCEVLYKAGGYYEPEAEGGLRWDDPELGIDWRLPTEEITVNGRDGALPLLRELQSPFRYG